MSLSTITRLPQCSCKFLGVILNKKSCFKGHTTYTIAKDIKYILACGRMTSYFSRFSRVTFAFSPYLLAPITRDHQMLKSSDSLDPLTLWAPYVLLCASCSPHVGLTDHTWYAALHMFASWPPHAHYLPHCSLMVSFHSIPWLY
jgi:hypothetical protein